MLDSIQVEEETRTPDGRQYTMLASKFPLIDPKGRPYAVCVMSIDITERKRIERQYFQTLNETLEQQVAERTAHADAGDRARPGLNNRNAAESPTSCTSISSSCW